MVDVVPHLPAYRKSSVITLCYMQEQVDIYDQNSSGCGKQKEINSCTIIHLNSELYTRIGIRTYKALASATSCTMAGAAESAKWKRTPSPSICIRISSK